jgi:hypothetical protein
LEKKKEETMKEVRVKDVMKMEKKEKKRRRK